MKLKPDFMIIGGPRSGTSFLYDLLIQHPDIYLRENKRPEPHFFALSERYNQGILEYYRMVFPNFNNEQISGEASTTMFYCANAIPLIKSHNENMKFILLLRDPMERMLSEYQRSVETGWENETFEKAIQREFENLIAYKTEYERTFKPGAYYDRSRYEHYLNQWLKYFPRENFFIGFTNDLINAPEAFLSDVFHFLGRENSVKVNLKKANKNSSHYKSIVSKKTLDKLNEKLIKENSGLERLLGFPSLNWSKI